MIIVSFTLKSRGIVTDNGLHSTYSADDNASVVDYGKKCYF